jgi:hypothetical protein
MTKDGMNVNKDENIRSFLMIGQSNMAGRGEFRDVEPIENPDCFMLRMGRWQQMYEPINPDRDIFKIKYHSGISLAASFADELQKLSGDRIGLIPCADGGTSIDQWMPGEVLFDHAVMMTRLAMRSSTFSGFLWHQGEADSYEGKLEVYQEKFITMISAMRRELGAEDLPVIIGELSEDIERLEKPNIIKMNENFHKIASVLPHCAVVSSKGLTLKDDRLHFNAVSLREFGKRYFHAYCEVEK